MLQYPLPHCNAGKAKTFIKIINIFNFWSKAVPWQIIEHNSGRRKLSFIIGVQKIETAMIFLSLYLARRKDINDGRDETNKDIKGLVEDQV